VTTLTPDAGLENVVRYLGVSLDEAHRLWSEAPAAAFGLPALAPSNT
jgi:N-acetylglucosamine-6-phosphate deacetylase